jgi:hypothetical protein
MKTPNKKNKPKHHTRTKYCIIDTHYADYEYYQDTGDIRNIVYIGCGCVNMKTKKTVIIMFARRK